MRRILVEQTSNTFIMKRVIILIFIFFSTFSQGFGQKNILLVIADDLGLGPVPGYLVSGTKATMPNLSALMTSGLTFDNVWSNPLCSPTRSTILSGKYGFRTNVLNANSLSQISVNETSLHSFISATHTSSIIGKWHLSGSSNPNPNYPSLLGIPYYAGLLAGSVQNYNAWNLTINGSTNFNNTYITSTITDLAINWINAQSSPWFCWLAYTAPHTPLHLPPLQMHTQGNLPTDSTSIASNPLPYFLAMTESVDYELGRLLDSIAPSILDSTVVIFIGDNGTDGSVIEAPYSPGKSKGSLFQGGINVPMVISGQVLHE